MNIIVNGGTRGIGRETVKHLAQTDDNKVFVTGRNETALGDLKKQYSNIEVLKFDLSRFADYSDDLNRYLTNSIKSVDILINTAGYLTAAEFMNCSEEDARQMMETNFFGPASVIRAVMPFMHFNSHIVNISSMGGFQGSEKYTGLSYYSASKAAIAVLTECLAKEFADCGIKVNCLAIGAVQTEMLEEAFPGYKAPVEAAEMGKFVAEFALTGQRFFNGKILPVALSNP